MARKKRNNNPELDQVTEDRDLRPAAVLPRQLPPPEIELEPLPKAEKRHAPDGFMNRSRHSTAGIGMNVSLDKSIVALQFDETRVPDRAEKDAIEEAGFRYELARRQWERPDDENPVTNQLSAGKLAQDLARAREGRAR